VNSRACRFAEFYQSLDCSRIVGYTEAIHIDGLSASR